MSNPKNALQERVAKFKGQHSIVYSDVATAGSAFQCSVTVTLTWQGVSKQWTATSVRSRCSKKESHFETAELLLGDSDLMYHCDAKNWGISSQPNRPDRGDDMDGNFKTRLNELCMRAKVVARYDTTPSAPFLSAVTIANPDIEEKVTVAGLRAGTKKAAEQSAAAAALADPSIRAMLGETTSSGQAPTTPGHPVIPQPHKEFAVAPVATTDTSTAMEVNPKGRLLELFARNQSLLWSSAKSPVFCTSTSAPFVSTVTIELPRGNSADSACLGALVLTGPGCPSKKGAEQAVAALALGDGRVRRLLRLPPLPSLPALPPAEEESTQTDTGTVGNTVSLQGSVSVGDNDSAATTAVEAAAAAECQPTGTQLSQSEEAGGSPVQAPLPTPSVMEDGVNSEQPMVNLAAPSTGAVPRPVVIEPGTENPKGRLLELFTRNGYALGAGPQFRTTTEAPFVTTLVVTLPERAAADAIAGSSKAVVLTGPERASKKAAEQAAAALALQDTRIRQAVGLGEHSHTGTAAPDDSIARPALLSGGANHKGRLLELCAKLPPSAQVRPTFSTSTTAPFVCTLQLWPGLVVTGPGRSTKKAAEQAAAALALQDSEIALVLGAGPSSPPAPALAPGTSADTVIL